MANIETMTVEDVMRRESASYLDIYFAHAFSTLTGRTETSVLSMVRGLESRMIANMSGRDKHQRAVRAACESIWDWYNQAHSYREMSTAVALDMIESHDPACVWAVMCGQAAKA